MSTWSTGDILAFATLLATCVPFVVFIFRMFLQRRRTKRELSDMERNDPASAQNQLPNTEMALRQIPRPRYVLKSMTF
ncbi:hypothetical protein IQ06DRAFT_297958 [Phaeosphaeriaceae sp. SRC1lsM3a]|nr:hypothetical protein IQ06DRAFT_297958 [Stagonospora sp. SRC1lsM3a]